MSQFQVYDRLRSYQLHCARLQSDRSQLGVPLHVAYSTPASHLERARLYQKKKQMEAIEVQNDRIMNKLVAINQRSSRSHSTPSLSLPALKRAQFRVPAYEQENNQIAHKIINSKPCIRASEQLQRYRTLEERRRRISRYDSSRGITIDRKQYMAEQLLMKKLQSSRVSRGTNPEQ